MYFQQYRTCNNINQSKTEIQNKNANVEKIGKKTPNENKIN